LFQLCGRRTANSDVHRRRLQLRRQQIRYGLLLQTLWYMRSTGCIRRSSLFIHLNSGNLAHAAHIGPNTPQRKLKKTTK